MSKPMRFADRLLFNFRAVPLISVLLLAGAASASDTGGSDGGGGHGVLCYTEASRAPGIAAGTPLSAQDIQNMQPTSEDGVASVTLVDLFELSGEQRGLIAQSLQPTLQSMRYDESRVNQRVSDYQYTYGDFWPSELVRHISGQLGWISPLFSMLGPHNYFWNNIRWPSLGSDNGTLTGQWQRVDNVQPVPITVRVAIPPGCVVVQLARYEDTRNEYRQITATRVTYDPRWYAKLSVIDRAALIIHETFYRLYYQTRIGAAIHMPESRDIRELTTWMLLGIDNSFFTFPNGETEINLGHMGLHIGANLRIYPRDLNRVPPENALLLAIKNKIISWRPSFNQEHWQDVAIAPIATLNAESLLQSRPETQAFFYVSVSCGNSYLSSGAWASLPNSPSPQCGVFVNSVPQLNTSAGVIPVASFTVEPNGNYWFALDRPNTFEINGVRVNPPLTSDEGLDADIAVVDSQLRLLHFLNRRLSTDSYAVVPVPAGSP